MRKIHLLLGILLSCLPMIQDKVYAGELDINDGNWSITFSSATKTLTYMQNGKTLLKGAFVQVRAASEEMLESRNYPQVSMSKESVHDVFGTGTKYTYTYSGLQGKDNIQQSIYVYPSLDYLLTDASLIASEGTTKTNYIAPIVSSTSVSFLPSTGQNYIYDMPHDNDNWVGYSAQPWNMGVSNTSCEVSGFYDVISREGLIVGSIEHDNWKSGITATPNGTNRLRNITVAAGVVSSRTNDVWDGRPSLSVHGSISGQKVSSPRYFLGYFNDWRYGLEQLGEATEKLCPKLPWDGGTIFAWQSWGGMAEKVNFEGAVNVSDFFHEQLEPKNFHNENGVCYIVLDSFWDNLNESQLKEFVRHCKANGQHPGIYHTPFSYWGNENDAVNNRPYDGSPYTWAQISLRANGQLRRIASIALDPTHPGTIEYNRRRFNQFKEWGFEYVKLDFINNGTLEADAFYEPGITTGMQAYTYGMDKVIEMADGMFIDLSIAPIFPAKGHARRISCDCWGELDNSMYSLNSLNLGWWLDRVYQYNDPDHLVLSRAENEGAARIRYSCGAMTGTVLLGDNYSLKGSCLGTQAERDLALLIATNNEINNVARLGRSFRPVEGGLGTSFNRWGQYFYGVDNEFCLDTDNAYYYVVFNFDKNVGLEKTESFERLGISANDVKKITELWTGENVSFAPSGIQVKVPKCDVRFYRLEKANWETSVQGLYFNSPNVYIQNHLFSLLVEAEDPFVKVDVCSIDGRLLRSSHFSATRRAVVDMNTGSRQVAIVRVSMADGQVVTQKITV